MPDTLRFNAATSAGGRSHNGRRGLFLPVGIAFVIVGGGTSILWNRLLKDPGFPLPPVLVQGRVVGSRPGFKAGGLLVQIRPVWANAMGKVGNSGVGRTDHLGEFVIRGRLTGPAYLYVREETVVQWIARPIGPIDLPSRTAVTITLTGGAAVRGRLLHQGKPLAGAPIYLAPRDRGSIAAFAFEPRRVETDNAGRFVFRNLLDGVEFVLYSHLGDWPAGAILPPRPVPLLADGAEVDLGDVAATTGRTIAGQIRVADGSQLPNSLGVEAWMDDDLSIMGALRSPRATDGRFLLQGIPDGILYLHPTSGSPIQPLPGALRISPRIAAIDPQAPWRIAGLVDQDLTDLAIILEPGGMPLSTRDPLALKHFNLAKRTRFEGAR